MQTGSVRSIDEIKRLLYSDLQSNYQTLASLLADNPALKEQFLARIPLVGQRGKEGDVALGIQRIDIDGIVPHVIHGRRHETCAKSCPPSAPQTPRPWKQSTPTLPKNPATIRNTIWEGSAGISF